MGRAENEDPVVAGFHERGIDIATSGVGLRGADGGVRAIWEVRAVLADAEDAAADGKDGGVGEEETDA